MTNQEQPVEPFVSIPRYVLDDLRDGIITPREFQVYVLVRLQANPYGIATVSTQSIFADLSVLKSKDWVSKIMRSLRCPRYLYYQERQGHRGSFRVHFGHLKLPNGLIRQIDKMFTQEELRSLPDAKVTIFSEDERVLDTPTPKSEIKNSATEPGESAHEDTTGLRSSYNDTDTHNAIHTEQSSSTLGKKNPTNSFVTQNDAEKRCKEIALEVDEPFIDYLLAKLNEADGHIEVIEDGFQRFQNVMRIAEEKVVDPVRNPGALFNYSIQSALEDYKLKKSGKW